jgi:hypothetical protein
MPMRIGNICWFVMACSILAADLPPAPPVMADGEMVDLQGGHPQAITPMLERRQDFQLSASDGRVLVTGGSTTLTTEWFNPTDRLFTAGPALIQPRSGHSALRLRDGRVLLLGGTEPAKAAECSNPQVTQFQALPGDVRFGLSAEAVELEDGRVFMVDGASGKAWVWDGRKSLSAVGALTRPRFMFRVLKLADGRVMVVGGMPAGKDGKPLPIEVFNPKWSQWKTLKSMPIQRMRMRLNLMPGGKVLLWGGHGSDPGTGIAAMELLDPQKDVLAKVGELHPGWGVMPSIVRLSDGRVALHPDKGHDLSVVTDADLPNALMAAPVGTLPLANTFQESTMVLAGERQVLLLGSALAGISMESWNPKGGQVQPMGVMRLGFEGVTTLPDKRVVTLGPIVDVLDSKTGSLVPLGWREDLQVLLKKAKAPDKPGKAFAKLPKGQERKGHLLVPLDKTTALLIGGSPGNAAAASTFLGFWDTTRKTVKPAGTMSAARVFKGRPGEGALKLADGSVLIWGGTEEK